MTATDPQDPIVIRTATPADDAALMRLAALDSAATLALPVLLAEVAGWPRAALSLSDGRAVADPFFPSADLVVLLRGHAERRVARGARRRSWRLPGLRRRAGRATLRALA